MSRHRGHELPGSYRAHVAPDFEEVINAYVEKQTKVQEAQTYREQEVPKAQADRDRAISEAEGFAALAVEGADEDEDPDGPGGHGADEPEAFRYEEEVAHRREHAKAQDFR